MWCRAAGAPRAAVAHLERPSYWPNRPRKVDQPGRRRDVPELLSRKSAVSGEGPAKWRVVCQGTDGRKSLRLLRESIAAARKNGYRVRPSQPKLGLTRKRARKLLRQNRALAERCRYKEIQPAVWASRNNDRVVVLPGRYTEPTSRKQPLKIRCAGLTQRDSTAPRRRATVPGHCPND